MCDILPPTDELKYPGAAGIFLGGPAGAAGTAGNTNGAEFGAGMLGAGWEAGKAEVSVADVPHVVCDV